jgi:putative tricarboxylic transport membrane protein
MARLGDAPIGAAFLALAGAVLWHIRDFPPAPGQPYGPALFPGLIAAGLAVASVLLIASAFRSGRRAAAFSGNAGEAEGAPAAAGLAGPAARRWLPFAATVATLIGYVAWVDRLGFIITAFLMLCVLFAAYRVRLAWIVPVAAVSTLVVHTAFYKLLKVPLPWGLLSGWVW